MSNKGFNPEDIADSISRFSRDRKKEKGPRSTTAGIPDFVPRTVVQQRNERNHQIQDEAVWSAAADKAAQQAQESLPPVTPCFSQADIDEFLARKPKKYQMTERDYKELGRNMILGVGDLIVGTVQAAAVIAPIMFSSKTQSTDSTTERYIRDDGEMGCGPGDGWKINI